MMMLTEVLNIQDWIKQDSAQFRPINLNDNQSTIKAVKRLSDDCLFILREYIDVVVIEKPINSARIFEFCDDLIHVKIFVIYGAYGSNASFKGAATLKMEINNIRYKF